MLIGPCLGFEIQGMRPCAQNAADSILSEAQVRLYNSLFLEAVCQGEQDNDVARYHLLKRALEVNPYGADAYYELATLAMSKGLAYEPTLQYLEKAHKYAPHNDDYTYIYAIALINEATRVDDGLALMHSLLSSPRMRNDAFETLTYHYENCGDYDNLVAVLEKWRPIKGDDESISYLKLKSALELGRHNDALLIADTLIASVPLHADFYRVLKGQIYAQANNSEMALKLYNEVIAHNPNMPEAQLLFLSYAFASDDDSIKRSALFAIITNPEQEMELRINTYRDFLNTFKPAERVAAIDSLLNHLLSLSEESPTLLRAIAQEMHEKSMDDSLLTAVYKKILEIEPADESTRLMLLVNLGNNSQFDEIKNWCTDGIKLNPEQFFYYYFLANVYMMEGSYDDAFKTAHDGLACITDDIPIEHASLYYSLYADCLHRQGDSDKAYSYYDTALQYNSANTSCLNNYAYFLSLEKRELDKAEAMALKAITIEPTSETFLDTYAWVLFVKKDYRKAAQYIDKAIANMKDPDDPNNNSLYEHAGDIYYHLGQKDKAMKHWRKAAALAPESEILQKKITNKRYFEE